MKRLLTTLIGIITVCGSALQAQEIRQFIDAYKGFILYENNGYSSYHLYGTRTIDGIEYVKDIDWRYFYRQDGNKIFCYSPAEGKEALVMDFGLEVGDTFALYDGLNVTVEQRADTLMECWWGETVCKILYLRGIEQPDFTDVWIEDVGSLRYGLNPPSPQETHMMYSSVYTEEEGLEFECHFDFQVGDVRGISVALGEDVGEEDFNSYEEYEAAHAGNRLTFDLRNDTLHIGGYIGGYCEDSRYFLVKESDEDIWISDIRNPFIPEADCISVKVIDVCISGFTKEKYTVHFGNITQSVSIESIEQEQRITLYHDLMGRPVAHPTRGIYIKDGKKVVIK